MKNDTNRIIIETMARKAIRDIQDAPKRSTRNIIDMALNFTNSRFQTHFFESAQKMLKNEQSAYYDLALDVVTHVSADRLIGFGMNVGYNACTLGAKTIRRIEEEENYNIPWTVTMMIDTGVYKSHLEQYRALVQQGKTIGIYAWQLCVTGDPHSIVSLIEENEDCAFAVLCDPEAVSEEFLEDISGLNNIMPVIRHNGQAARICGMLRERELLYSVFKTYDREDAPDIVSGDYFLSAEELHPVFTMLAAKVACPQEVREQVYNAVVKLRRTQTLRAIPWEVTYDASFVDGVISNEPCSVLFDAQGYLHNWYSRETATEYNIFHSDLVSILRQTQKKHG